MLPLHVKHARNPSPQQLLHFLLKEMGRTSTVDEHSVGSISFLGMFSSGGGGEVSSMVCLGQGTVSEWAHWTGVELPSGGVREMSSWEAAGSDLPDADGMRKMSGWEVAGSDLPCGVREIAGLEVVRSVLPNAGMVPWREVSGSEEIAGWEAHFVFPVRVR